MRPPAILLALGLAGSVLGSSQAPLEERRQATAEITDASSMTSIAASSVTPSAASSVTSIAASTVTATVAMQMTCDDEGCSMVPYQTAFNYNVPPLAPYHPNQDPEQEACDYANSPDVDPLISPLPLPPRAHAERQVISDDFEATYARSNSIFDTPATAYTELVPTPPEIPPFIAPSTPTPFGDHTEEWSIEDARAKRTAAPKKRDIGDDADILESAASGVWHSISDDDDEAARAKRTAAPEKRDIGDDADILESAASGVWHSISDDDDEPARAKRTAAPELVRHPFPPFLRPGPCTDCAPFEQFVGNGAAHMPAHKREKRNDKGIPMAGTITTEVFGQPATQVYSIVATSPSTVLSAKLAAGGETMTTSGILASGTDGAVVEVLKLSGYGVTFTWPTSAGSDDQKRDYTGSSIHLTPGHEMEKRQTEGMQMAGTFTTELLGQPFTRAYSIVATSPTPIVIEEVAAYGQTMTVSAVFPSGTDGPIVAAQQMDGEQFTATWPAAVISSLQKRDFPDLPVPITPGLVMTRMDTMDGILMTEVFSVVATDPFAIDMHYTVGTILATVSASWPEGTDGPEVDAVILNQQTQVITQPRPGGRMAIKRQVSTADNTAATSAQASATVSPQASSAETAATTVQVTVAASSMQTVTVAGDETSQGTLTSTTDASGFQASGSATAATTVQTTVAGSSMQTVTMVGDQTSPGTLISTTDASGNPVWVTRTDDFASSTTTVLLDGLTATVTVSTSSSTSVQVATATVTAPAPIVTANNTLTSTVTPPPSSSASVQNQTSTVTAPAPIVTANNTLTSTVTLPPSSSTSVQNQTSTVTAFAPIPTVVETLGATTTASTAQPSYTEVRTIVYTETLFDPLRRCTRKASLNPYMTSLSTAHLFGQDIAITAPTMTINNQTVVAVESAEATLFPVNKYQGFVRELVGFDSDLVAGANMSKNPAAKDIKVAARDGNATISDSTTNNMNDIRKHYPQLNWAVVAEVAHVLQRSDPTMDPELASRFAALWVVEHPELSDGAVTTSSATARPSVTSTMSASTDSKGNTITVGPRDIMPTHTSKAKTRHSDMVNSTMANINGELIRITQPTQNIGNHTVLVVPTTTRFDWAWAAQQRPVATPPPCIKGPDYNKTKCKVGRCMLKNYAPINITTVFPAAIFGDSGDMAYGQFTQSTSITGAHFGKTKSGNTYYPTQAFVTTGKDGQPKPTASAVVPTGKHFMGLGKIPTQAHAWDLKSCCEHCNWEAKHAHGHWKWIAALAGALAALLLALLALCCCLRLCRRRARKNKNNNPNAKPPLAQRLFGRNKAGQPVAAIDPATGLPMAQVPQPVQLYPAYGGDPVGTTPGGAAPGSTVASGDPAGGSGPATTGANGGKGTMGKKAEEGRAQVQFANGTGPGQTVDQPATSTEQVQPIDARHDGTKDGIPTGRQMADMGSMRGRRPNRNDGVQDLLNVRF
ncbi:hypothetical protein LTR08_008788 [Meristemomyces frigidus]|nr:hypothetical protein LTR08_008788 [Meristemomyces frigidus]